MISEARCQELIETAIRGTAADEVEVMVSGGRLAVTRFANSAIHQNVAEEGVSLSVRAVVGRRTARASTNRLDAEGIGRVAEDAVALARLQPEDPELQPIPGPQVYQDTADYVERTLALTPEDRARAAGAAIAICGERGLQAAGVMGTGGTFWAIGNSRGLFAYSRYTSAEFSVTALGKDSSGWAKGTASDVGALDVRGMAESAAEKALRGQGPREIPPGRYTVILEPSAVTDLVGFLLWDFSGLAVLEKRSSLTGKQGQKIFGGNVTLLDDVCHPLHIGTPFDGEGIPRQRVVLVERGVQRGLVYSRATAARAGAAPTGHGLLLPNALGEYPFHLVMEGGKATVEEMVRSTRRGLLVTRFWYIRTVDPMRQILTGMTRDGTFLIEDGEIVGGVKNLRFNQSLYDMLSGVEMLGRTVRASGEEHGDGVVPPLKVEGFTFSAATSF